MYITRQGERVILVESPDTAARCDSSLGGVLQARLHNVYLGNEAYQSQRLGSKEVRLSNILHETLIFLQDRKY